MARFYVLEVLLGLRYLHAQSTTPNPFPYTPTPN